MTIKQAKNKLVKWAQGQVGYKPSTGKYNKYAEYLDSLGNFYNYPKNGYDWCDVFVDCGFVQCFGAETGRKMLYQPLKSCGAGCYFSAGYYKANGAFTMTPAVGDQIFYGQDAGDHTGIVIKVSKNYVQTIEGNWNNQVCQRKLLRTDYRIAGYGRPKWSLVADVQEEEPKPIEEPKETTYTVQAGDTLQSIAERFGTTVDQIAKDNNLPNINLIYPNEVLIIRKSEKTDDDLKIGDKVKIRNGARTYYGGELASFVYSRIYTLAQLDGDRAVVSFNNVIVAAVHAGDLIRV